MTTIAIVSQKGGSGKTTLALHLAAAFEAVGETALVIDTDPQATACQWASWRSDAPPAVIDSAPPRLAVKIAQAHTQGARVIIIDTPPHADSAASKAVEVADLVLVPCRPSAFDLAAIRTTAQLVALHGKPAFALFTAGPPQASRLYADAADLVASFGLHVCPHFLPERAAYRHASAAGHTVLDYEPQGRAAREVAQVHRWTCEQVPTSTPPQAHRSPR